MNNVIDRRPTQPGRMKITHSNGNVEYVVIERADEPEEVGTAINKVLFDSIQDDLNTRLLIESKATVEEAKNGTEDSHYMTAQKTKEAINAIHTIPYALKNGFAKFTRNCRQCVFKYRYTFKQL